MSIDLLTEINRYDIINTYHYKRKEEFILKKIMTYIAIAAALCMPLSSCGDKKKSEPNFTKYDVDTTKAPKPTDPYIDDAVTAESGEVYLAVADSQWKAQYLGNSDGAGTTLSYDAGVVEINGNGDYTVSVNADTEGFRYAVSGDANYTGFVPQGMEFMAVIIKEGETKYPNAVITVNEIRVDGEAVELTAKAYTSSDDGINTRANLINRWTSKPSPDARSVDGPLYDSNGEPLDICAEYSPKIVGDEAFASWTNVEVDITISGI